MAASCEQVGGICSRGRLGKRTRKYAEILNDEFFMKSKGFWGQQEIIDSRCWKKVKKEHEWKWKWRWLREQSFLVEWKKNRRYAETRRWSSMSNNIERFTQIKHKNTWFSFMERRKNFIHLLSHILRLPLHCATFQILHGHKKEWIFINPYSRAQMLSGDQISEAQNGFQVTYQQLPVFLCKRTYFALNNVLTYLKTEPHTWKGFCSPETEVCPEISRENAKNAGNTSKVCGRFQRKKIEKNWPEKGKNIKNFLVPIFACGNGEKNRITIIYF